MEWLEYMHPNFQEAVAQTYTPNTVVVFHCGGCTEQVNVTEGGVFINQFFQVANERETCSSSVATCMASFEWKRLII